MIKIALLNVERDAFQMGTDSRAVKGDRLKICCVSFVGSNPTSCKTRLAQLVERTPFKRVVEGSSPSSGDGERWPPRKDRQGKWGDDTSKTNGVSQS